MDPQKVRLLRSYSRSKFISSTSLGAPETSSSPSGLERLFPRTSTPLQDDHKFVDNSSCFDPYELFRHAVEKPLKTAHVRGIEPVPYHFFTGNLIPEGGASDVTTIMFDVTNEVRPPRRRTMKMRLVGLKKSLKNFFKRYYKALIRNRCDYSVCPARCECQRLKSFLNKTIVLDDEELSALEG
ncbi:hypothetical protein MTP99_009907 [Tenebrio molitor]|nr:hypothetical protein MTP99_009907 [Tenebrio molitor]